MASTKLTTTTPPLLRVTATGSAATHVVEVRGLRKLRKNHRGDQAGYVGSEIFTVDGVDWTVRCNPDGGEGDEQGYLGVFVQLVTRGVAVWAHVTFGLVDWTTGRADPFFSTDEPVLFSAGNGKYNGSSCCNWGTGRLASWSKELRRRSSRYLRNDCVQIECAVYICHFALVFRDDDGLKCTPQEEAAIAMLKLDDGRSKEGDDDMPRRLAVEALQQFARDGSLPVVEDMTVDGYRDMFRHLLLAAQRYRYGGGGGGGMRRLSAICERVLSRCIDVDSVAATLAMAQRHGFQELREACLQFASNPNNYGLVRGSKGYAAELNGCQETFYVEMELWAKETFYVEMELWAKYCERNKIPCDDESQEIDLHYHGLTH